VTLRQSNAASGRAVAGIGIDTTLDAAAVDRDGTRWP